MPFLGTIINTVVILVGCTIGCFFASGAALKWNRQCCRFWGFAVW